MQQQLRLSRNSAISTYAHAHASDTTSNTTANSTQPDSTTSSIANANGGGGLLGCDLGGDCHPIKRKYGHCIQRLE